MTKELVKRGKIKNNLAGLKTYKSFKEAVGDVNENLERQHLKLHDELTGAKMGNLGARKHSLPGIGAMKGQNMSAGNNTPKMHPIRKNPLGEIF